VLVTRMSTAPADDALALASPEDRWATPSPAHDLLGSYHQRSRRRRGCWRVWVGGAARGVLKSSREGGLSRTAATCSTLGGGRIASPRFAFLDPRGLTRR
jgi:hypothetical protein